MKRVFFFSSDNEKLVTDKICSVMVVLEDSLLEIRVSPSRVTSSPNSERRLLDKFLKL